MLVVAYQAPVPVGRERRLARTRQSEKQRHAHVVADVGRTMHRQYVFWRQQIIQQREDRLLHLARVARAHDQHQPAFEIDHDAGLRARAVALRIALEVRREHQRELRLVIG